MQCIKIGFELGLITKEELISFSEAKLLQEDYNDIILDIASLDSKSSMNQFIEILKEIDITQVGFSECHSRILYRLEKKYNNWKELQIQLIKYYNIVGKYLDVEDFEFWSRIKDDYELREEGFSGCMKMPDELECYLKKNSIICCENSSLINLNAKIN